MSVSRIFNPPSPAQESRKDGVKVNRQLHQAEKRATKAEGRAIEAERENSELKQLVAKLISRPSRSSSSSPVMKRLKTSRQ